MTSIFVKLQAESSMVATVFYKWSFGDVHEKAFLKTLRQEIKDFWDTGFSVHLFLGTPTGSFCYMKIISWRTM